MLRSLGVEQREKLDPTEGVRIPLRLLALALVASFGSVGIVSWALQGLRPRLQLRSLSEGGSLEPLQRERLRSRVCRAGATGTVSTGLHAGGRCSLGSGSRRLSRQAFKLPCRRLLLDGLGRSFMATAGVELSSFGFRSKQDDVTLLVLPKTKRRALSTSWRRWSSAKARRLASSPSSTSLEVLCAEACRSRLLLRLWTLPKSANTLSAPTDRPGSRVRVALALV